MTNIVARIQLLKFPVKISALLCLGTLFLMILVGILAKNLSGAFLGWFVFVVVPSIMGLGLMRIFFADDWQDSD